MDFINANPMGSNSDPLFQSMWAKCGNCNRGYRDENHLTTIIAVEDLIKNEINEVLVWDALAYIYGATWEEFKIHLDKKSQNTSKHTMTSLNTSSIAVCQMCSPLLSQNFNSHQKFENSMDFHSLVQQVKNSCGRMSSTRGNYLSDVESNGPSPSEEHDEEGNNSDFFDRKPQLSGNFMDGIKCEPLEPEDSWESEEDEIPKRAKLRSSRRLQVSAGKLSKESQYYEGQNSSPKEGIIKTVKHSDTQRQKKRTKRERRPKSSSLSGRPKKLKSQDSGQRKLEAGREEKSEGDLLDDNKCAPLPGVDGQYQCDICEKKFTSWEYLKKRHIPTHSADMSCSICHKKYNSGKGLQYHIKSAHTTSEKKEDIFQTCQVCGKLINRNSMKTHMGTHGPRIEYKCPKCGKVYLDKRFYDEHLYTHEDNFVPYLCRHCPTTFQDKRTLANHEKLHTEEKKHKCSICPAKFHLKNNLLKHINTHSSDRMFTCDECGNSYKGKTQLDHHLKIHKEVSEKGEYSAKCEDCGKIFKNSATLRNHRQEFHSNRKTHDCQVCGKSFVRARELVKHENIHKSDRGNKPRGQKSIPEQQKWQLLPPDTLMFP